MTDLETEHALLELRHEVKEIRTALARTIRLLRMAAKAIVATTGDVHPELSDFSTSKEPTRE